MRYVALFVEHINFFFRDELAMEAADPLGWLSFSRPIPMGGMK